MNRVGLHLVTCLLWGALARGSDLTLQGMDHKVWAAAEGAPSAVAAIAQTSDGTLWLGSATGLFRFDGMRFERYPASPDPPFPAPNVSALAVSPDGSLWIGFRFGGISRLRDGQLHNYGERDGLPDGTVKSLVWDRDGVFWVAARGGLARLRGDRWEKVAHNTIPTTYGAMVDRNGTLWVASEDWILARRAGAEEFRQVAKRGGPEGGSPPFSVSPDRLVWARTDAGFTRMDLLDSGQPKATLAFQIKGYTPLLFDRAGSLWLGGGGAIRLISPEQTAAEFSDDLTQGGVQSFFQDREGDVWVGAGRGLARFVQSSVVRVPLPACVDWGYTLVAGAAASVWITCADPASTRGVTEIRDGVVTRQHDSAVFTAAYADPDGSVWFGGLAGFGHISPDGRIETLDVAAQAAGFEIQSIVRERNTGALWISVLRKGVFRLAAGKWVPYGDLDGLPRSPAVVMTVEASGVLWFAYTDNRIARVAGRNVQLFGTRDGLDVGNVTAITIRGTHIWVSGDLGLARFDGTRFVRVLATAGNPFTGVTGIVETQAGELWLNGNLGISRVLAEDVARVCGHPEYRVRAQTFNYLDGVPGIARQVRPIPSAVESSDGRLWFATEGGVVFVDPRRIIHNTQPPPVTIWSISAGGVRYAAHDAELHLPIHTTSLRLDYTAGSLTIPERVGFRYKLEGFDQTWQDPGGRREAFYTNLAPGQYTFRVIAANNDGVWNTSGASARFAIAPAFYQTKWFHGLFALAGAALLVTFYRLRMQQVSARALSRLEERLVERERIARELHDTLLQGVQGLILRFQAHTDIIPAHEPARAAMERTLERADELLAESRARVKDLRAPSSGLVALPEALAAEGKQLADMHSTQFCVSTEGAPRELHPIVLEEAALIGREALANAFRHAHATRVEAEVYYGDTELRVLVRDNGCGIDPAVLKVGAPPGHWGVVGMRERAGKLSALLQVWSTQDAGTEIALRVPAAVAYSEAWRPQRRPWWRRGARGLLKELQ